MSKMYCAVAALILFICFVTAPATAGDPPKLVGLALPEAGTDKGWNEQGKAGLEIVAKKYGFKIELAEALGYGDIKPTLRDMVKKGCELIICHASGYQTVAPEIARETGVSYNRRKPSRHHSGTDQRYRHPTPGWKLSGRLAGRQNDPI